MTLYTVQPNDTLSQIAQRFLGDAGLWLRLYFLNARTVDTDPRVQVCLRRFGGESSDWIFPGQRLVLP